MSENLQKISVIVSVYNNAKFLKKCIDSILAQTYPNIEILLVDDASKDDSYKIINNYLTTYKNIKYIKHDTNKGIVQTRLTGIKAMSGDYFCFVDSCDSISKDYVRKMYRTITKAQADICFADWVYEYKDGRKKYIPTIELRNVDIDYKDKMLFDKFMIGHGYDLTWHVAWNKMYSKKLLDKALPYIEEFGSKYGHTVMAEDVMSSMTFFWFCERAVNTHNVYYYHNYSQSFADIVLDHKKYKKNLMDITHVVEYMRDFLSKVGVAEKYSKDLATWERRYYNLYYDFAVDGEKKRILKSVFEIPLDKNCEDMYFISKNAILVDFGTQYGIYENIIHNILRKDTEVVSFDIFDTLVKRNVYYPTDLFIFMSNKLKNEISSSFHVNLQAMRVDAETSSRKLVKGQEINFDEIYDYMKKNYGLDESLIDKMKALEVEYEKLLVKTRNTGFDLYDIATINGKKVIYTTDMYLTKDIIYDLLEQSGYSRENEMFLSNEYRLTKGTGQLYKEVKKKYNLAGSKIVHIGDNYHSDVISAQDNGIRAFHMPSTKDRLETFLIYEMVINNHTNYDLKNMPYIDLREMFALVGNELFDFPYIDKFSMYQNSTRYIGYFAVGLYLNSFIEWVINSVKGRNKVHFVARDGYLPMVAYDILKETKGIKDLPESNYLYMSRKFLYPLSIYSKADLYTTPTQLHIVNHSIEKILSYFPKECIKQDNVNAIDKTIFTKKFGSTDDYCKVIDLIDGCIDYKKLSEYQSKVKNYYDGIITDNDVLVDIGYSGRGEVILKRLLNKTIDSVYLHPLSDLLYSNQGVAGFKCKCFYENKPKVVGELRELIFMKNDPSFIGINFDDKGEAQYVFDVKNAFNDYELSIMAPIKENALKFIKDYATMSKDLPIHGRYPREFVAQPMENLLHAFDDEDKIIFKDFIFEDDIGLGFIKLIDSWNRQNYKNPYSYSTMQHVEANRKPKKLTARKVINKLLPENTKRKKFATKVANVLLPKGSKRRKAFKKLIKM